MNNKFFIALFLFLLVNFSFASAQIDLDIFKKKWKLSQDMQKKLSVRSPEEEQAFKQLNEAQRKRIEKDVKIQAESSSFEFFSNNTFKIVIEGLATYEGTWRLADDGKTILVRSKEGIEERIIIKKLQSDMLVVASENRGADQELVLVPKQ